MYDLVSLKELFDQNLSFFFLELTDKYEMLMTLKVNSQYIPGGCYRIASGMRQRLRLNFLILTALKKTLHNNNFDFFV